MPVVKTIERLTIKEKIEFLDKLKNGHTVKFICEKYKINKSTACRIKQSENKLRKFIENTECGPGKRCTLKIAEYPKMESRLYRWFLKQRSRNVPVSGDILRAKACDLHNIIKEKPGGFNASQGWLINLKKRHGIRLLKISGEKLSNKTHLVDPFVEKFKKTIEELGLTRNQIYNADESGLFFRLLPDKTLVSAKEASAPGRKTSKERVTFLPCTNATGLHKLKLMVIGKSANPRAFKNFCNNPVLYKSSKNAWMTSSIFEQWFKNTFVPEVSGTFNTNLIDFVCKAYLCLSTLGKAISKL